MSAPIQILSSFSGILPLGVNEYSSTYNTQTVEWNTLAYNSSVCTITLPALNVPTGCAIIVYLSYLGDGSLTDLDGGFASPTTTPANGLPVITDTAGNTYIDTLNPGFYNLCYSYCLNAKANSSNVIQLVLTNTGSRPIFPPQYAFVAAFCVSGISSFHSIISWGRYRTYPPFYTPSISLPKKGIIFCGVWNNWIYEDSVVGGLTKLPVTMGNNNYFGYEITSDAVSKNYSVSGSTASRGILMTGFT